MANWRDTLVTDALAKGASRGILVWDQKAVDTMFAELSVAEKDKPDAEKIGYHYVKTVYKERGLSSFYKQLEKMWPGYTAPAPKQKTKQEAPQMETTPPSPPTPPAPPAGPQ